MSEYFPKPESLGANVKVELDLSNYATKSDLKNATVVDTSDTRTDLANLKPDVYKLLKKLTITQKLMILKRKLLIMTTINILILKNLIN